jgi:hypothetical protein
MEAAFSAALRELLHDPALRSDWGKQQQLNDLLTVCLHVRFMWQRPRMQDEAVCGGCLRRPDALLARLRALYAASPADATVVLHALGAHARVLAVTRAEVPSQRWRSLSPRRRRGAPARSA